MFLNKVFLIGNLTRDPEVRSTPSGQTVTTLGIATNRVWTTPQGEKQEKTEFHTVICWGKLGETTGKYLVKGQSVLVEGRIETRSWQDKTSGDKRYRTEIIAESVQFGSKPSGSGQGARAFAPKGAAAKQADDSPAEDLPVIQEDEPDIEVKDIPF